jgi:hypothetical protein
MLVLFAGRRQRPLQPGVEDCRLGDNHEPTSACPEPSDEWCAAARATRRACQNSAFITVPAACRYVRADEPAGLSRTAGVFVLEQHLSLTSSALHDTPRLR